MNASLLREYELFLCTCFSLVINMVFVFPISLCKYNLSMLYLTVN